ncbi:MAG: aspartyl protease family protein [Patescibacteria group bacterium]
MTAHMLTGAMILFAALPARGETQDCRFHVLGRTGGEFEVRRETIPDGEARAFVQSETLLSLILPWSAGQSGEIVQPSQGPVAYAVRCRAGSILVTVQKKGADPRALPAIEAPALSRYRIRVSVAPGAGRPVVFIIAPDGLVSRDTIAPPTDMFRGAVPLQSSDVSITTEIREEVNRSVTGSAELRRAGPYFLASLVVQGGGKGDAIVDLGASRTLITRALLPPGIEPSALVAVEHGPDGERARSGSLGALGGEVADIRAARVPRLTIGGLTFEDVRVNVIDSLPVIGGVRVEGIIGTDMLGAGPITRIGASASGAQLSLVGKATPGHDLEAPFSRVGGLVMLSARVGDRSIPLILDTGARSTLLSESVALALGLERLPQRDTFRGLDGRPIETWSAVIPTVSIGSGHLDSLSVNVAPLPVLKAMGIADGGLLGQNLWERFSSLEVDWVREVVRFYDEYR